jgi:hypothetical protein
MSEMHASTTQALQSLASQGITAPGEVSEITVPSNYSEIPDHGEGNLGDLMGQLASFLSYLEHQYSIRESEYDLWSNQLEFERKRVLLTLENERKDLMEAKVESAVAGLKTVVMTKYTEMKLLKAILEGKKRIAESLSRELSRRNLVFQMSRGGL